MMLLHMALGAGALLVGRFGYLAVKKAIPVASSAAGSVNTWLKKPSATTTTATTLTTLQADVAAIKAKVGA
jgi:hypothetical protein